MFLVPHLPSRTLGWVGGRPPADADDAPELTALVEFLVARVRWACVINAGGMLKTVVSLAFRPLAETDLPQLARWLAADHVQEWWRDPSAPKRVRGQRVTTRPESGTSAGEADQAATRDQ